MTTPTHEQIAQVAYSKFCERGRQSGGDVDDWLAAERDVAESLMPRETPKPKQKQTRTRTRPRTQTQRQTQTRKQAKKRG